MAQLSLTSSSIFISNDIYERFNKILSLCRTKYNLYLTCNPMVDVNGSRAILNTKMECIQRTTQIQTEFDSLIVDLRTYIANQLK